MKQKFFSFYIKEMCKETEERLNANEEKTRVNQQLQPTKERNKQKAIRI